MCSSACAMTNVSRDTYIQWIIYSNYCARTVGAWVKSLCMVEKMILKAI